MPVTQTQTFTPPPNPSTPGTPEWLYDEIMRHIEPDLLTSALSKHAEKYANESREARLERMLAYDEAFMIFDSVEVNMGEEIQTGLKHLRDEAQAKVTQEEHRQLGIIEEELEKE